MICQEISVVLTNVIETDHVLRSLNVTLLCETVFLAILEFAAYTICCLSISDRVPFLTVMPLSLFLSKSSYRRPGELK